MEKVQDIGACNSLANVFSKKWMKVHTLFVFFKNTAECRLKVANSNIRVAYSTEHREKKHHKEGC